MAGDNTEYLGKHKKFRTDYKKLAAAFIALAVIVAIIVFWWLKLVGITVTGDAFCGMNEHTHGENCYVSELICENSEEKITAEVSEGTLPSEEDGTAETADEEETTEAQTSAESHIHGDECYKNVLTCTLKEHIHTSDCYPDFSADVEIENDWLATFEDVVLTKNVSENLVNIVKTQLGYAESELNFEYDEEGTKRGYTRYGEWYGNPYGNWNAMFVSFCLNYSNIQETESVISSSAETMHQQWQEAELFEPAETHNAKAGELIFLDTDNDEVTDHVAIISEVSEDEIKVIIGDLDNCVEEINIDDSMVIIGYGLTDKLKNIEEETTTEETTTQETTTEVTTTEETTTQSTAVDKEILSVMDVYEDPEWDEKVAEFENSLEEDVRSKLDELPRKDRKAVLELSYTISLLPTVDEFFEDLDRYYESGDEDAEMKYITVTQEKMVSAYAHYQPIHHLEEYIIGLSDLLELKDIYSNFSFSTFTTGTSSAVTFNYINRGWSAVAPIIIYGGSANEKLTTGSNVNQYWNGIVVEYDSAGQYYYVSNKYTGGSESSATTVRNLEATTPKGFVIFIWMADDGATTAQKNAAKIAADVVVGDRVTVSIDPTTHSSGYSAGGYGVVRFSEKPTEPEVPEEPIVEDIPLESIQNGEGSDKQVKYVGAKTTSPEDDVQISKSIDGTNIENVFDITLTVRTETNVQTYLEEPDMAVVIVMDISNTMNDKYPDNQNVTSRYDAAVEAAENFINQFAEETDGLSKVGFVAFNTNSRKIFDLSPCGDEAQAATLISEMKSETYDIISNYITDDRSRFTNVEAGLQMGYDMLAESNNENKYIVFLSDGFPTTYYNPNNANNSSEMYYGYETYTSSGTKGADGVFYDYVTGYYCQYGTSYSDKASIRAREVATKIKNLGAKIFSIGIDVGGQTIAGFERNGLSVIDRTSRTYEIGDASSTSAYQNWLRNSIGSGYYYDSTAKDDIKKAFTNIFTEIKNLNKESRYTIWTSTDPLPVFDEGSAIVEFIHFYDLKDKPAAQLDGAENGEGLENNARHVDGVIFWDLKYSGYTTSEETVGDLTTTYYHYSITYRVRLYNEKQVFVEYTDYTTNGEAFLEYKTIVDANGVKDTSELKVLDFAKPVVEGYVSGFEFTKTSDLGNPLAGAEFTLTHDDEVCSECHGNDEPITTVSKIGPYVSQADGSVTFDKIPSGHTYILNETVPPNGFTKSGSTFSVQVAYDELTVTETKSDGTKKVWTDNSDYIVTNPPIVYILPETGGPGTLHLTIIGLALMAFPILYSILRRKRERRFN